MGEEIAFENGRISDFQGLVTLTFNRVILHTFMHHSSTSTYSQILLKSKKLYCGRLLTANFKVTSLTWQKLGQKSNIRPR